MDDAYLVAESRKNWERIKDAPNQTDEMRAIVGEHQVVVAIYAKQPAGLGKLVIKGTSSLSGAAQAGRVDARTITAIFCKDAADAESMDRAYGERQ
jgi:hypothetical protein